MSMLGQSIVEKLTDYTIESFVTDDNGVVVMHFSRPASGERMTIDLGVEHQQTNQVKSGITHRCAVGRVVICKFDYVPSLMDQGLGSHGRMVIPCH